MKNKLCCRGIVLGALGAAVFTFANRSSAQAVTNAFDVAQNYAGTGFTGNQGTGFGAWTLSTSVGGSYISGDTPKNFGIWNNTANGSSTALRPFNSSLSVGQTFSVQLEMIHLDTSANQNVFSLLNSSGQVLFSYWHQGGDNANGHYTDAGVIGGVATGFSYDFSHMDSFSFALTSATTYTFSDLSTGASFSGTVSDTISQVEFLRVNQSASAPSDGQDFKFNSLTITEVPEPSSLAIVLVGAGVFVFRCRVMSRSKS